jgi:hypothetical protein
MPLKEEPGLVWHIFEFREGARQPAAYLTHEDGVYFFSSKWQSSIWYESEFAAEFGRQGVNSRREIQAKTAMHRPEFLEQEPDSERLNFQRE